MRILLDHALSHRIDRLKVFLGHLGVLGPIKWQAFGFLIVQRSSPFSPDGTRRSSLVWLAQTMEA